VCASHSSQVSPRTFSSSPTQSLRVDEVRLKLLTTEGEQIWLTAGACELQPGATSVKVFCPVSTVPLLPRNARTFLTFSEQTAATGVLLLELSQLRFSRIIFQYSHRPPSPPPLQSTYIRPVVNKQPSLLVHRDYQAVHIYIEDPESGKSALPAPKRALITAFLQSTSMRTAKSSSASTLAVIRSLDSACASLSASKTSIWTRSSCSLLKVVSCPFFRFEPREDAYAYVSLQDVELRPKKWVSLLSRMSSLTRLSSFVYPLMGTW
jgi:hypothetical protein